ncbi:helicase RepA family protein [Methylobacterium sp. J-001]|uniref:AAA family ATPase n=1 Tax=Methylobacterium sp. J-001 TaxID=2836609 RepID=UPI001FB9A519|nr:AAA family ATPase [Methylobacterium sp. J-001]MCJ2120651.1 helicase RepA family protein [Methylobacterium sp. J-001]
MAEAAYKIDRLPPLPPKPQARRFGSATAAELMDEVLPPIRYIVPGIFAEGLTLFGGKPKLGKSWFLLGTAIAVAMGGVALGNIEVEQGDVLYLALEDNKRRLQKRLGQLLPTGKKPVRLHYDLNCRRLDDGGLDDIRAWIESQPDPRLVIVDVLNKVRPAMKGNEGIYDYDVRSLEGLQGLAAEFGVAVVVIHHTRKAEAEDPFDCLSGSTGLTGTADTTLVLARDSQGTTLYGRGRDIEEIESALSFDRTTGAWTMLGAAADVRRSDERNLILDALRNSPEPMSPKDIMLSAGLENRNALDVMLFRMVTAGEIDKAGRGLYCLAGVNNPCKNGKNVRSGNRYGERYDE